MAKRFLLNAELYAQLCLVSFPLAAEFWSWEAAPAKTHLFHAAFQVVLTDPSPTMVSIACAKLAPQGQAVAAAAGESDVFAARYLYKGKPQFDMEHSPTSPTNCVLDLKQTALGPRASVEPGAPAMLVLFGTFLSRRDAHRDSSPSAPPRPAAP